MYNKARKTCHACEQYQKTARAMFMSRSFSSYSSGRISCCHQRVMAKMAFLILALSSLTTLQKLCSEIEMLKLL